MGLKSGQPLYKIFMLGIEKNIAEGNTMRGRGSGKKRSYGLDVRRRRADYLVKVVQNSEALRRLWSTCVPILRLERIS